MRSILTAAACACLSAALALDAAADTITYAFSGLITNSSLPPLAIGTPFSGSLTLDTSQAGVPFSPTVTEFAQSAPPGNLTIEANGMILQSTLAGKVVVSEFSPGVMKFTETFLSAEIGGNGWSYEQTPNDHEPEAYFVTYYYGAVVPTDFSQIPTFGAGTNILTGVELALATGVLTYPGGSFTLDRPDRIEFEITNLSVVPEPSSWLLGSAAWAGLLAIRRRK